jgi:preprotein translocase subunit SecA
LRDPDRPEDITPEQARLLGHLEQAMRAEFLFKRNKDYVVQGGRVIIVDEFTGRLMPGRRWSDGLHQAVEAKEGVRVRQENVTYATITLQNYFRMYKKLAGMTGTAVTEAEEFNKIYKVDVLPLPTNLEYIAMQPDSDLLEVEYRENGNKFFYYARKDDPERKPIFWKRKDYPDVVFRTEEAKLRAVTTEILRRHVRGQPMLVGTTSVELSERLSRRLRAELLRKLANVLIIRDAYLEAHGIPNDGMRVEALQPLYEPIESLPVPTMRKFARQLGLSLNPAKPENLERLMAILGLEPQHGEKLAAVLEGGIRHNVLNAKKHDEESRIIAGAGALGAVTIATNMAGRGVDIKLGGEIAEEVLAAVNRVLRRAGIESPETLNMEERMEALERVDSKAIGIYEAEVQLFRDFIENEKKVREAGGLHVIGSERHESRRIDNQLRGRAARQGDPGSSRFFLSLEDELMRLFGGAQVSNLMARLNIDDAMPIAHNIVNRTIEQAQSRVEGANFDTRKHLLEYDDVLNQQREVYYGQRNRVFAKDDLLEDVHNMLVAEVQRRVEAAGEDPEGYWKLLAWLEETQPTLNLEEGEVYPSYMLRKIVGSLAHVQGVTALKSALLEIAEGALAAQYAHLQGAIYDQWERVIERLENQVRQRMEMAEIALEGAELEAEERGVPLEPRALIQAVEQATGLQVRMDERSEEFARQDIDAFRKQLPQLVESSLALRAWAGIVQAVERRLGESLGLEPSLPMPIHWDQAEERLQQALQETWTRRQERLLREIERDLETWLAKVDRVDERLMVRLLVQMSYGTRSYFDRKTHQRRAVSVARLAYPYYAARFIEGREPDELEEEIVAHLRQAQEAMALSMGRQELARLARNRLDDLPETVLTFLKEEMAGPAFEAARQVPELGALGGELREALALALGRHLLTEAYRGLILSVGDQLWVDYLTQIEALRTSIGLEAYAQRDPLVQYKSRAFDMFQNLLGEIRAGVVSRLFRVRPGTTVGAGVGRAEGQGQPVAQAAGATSSKKGRRRRRKRKR